MQGLNHPNVVPEGDWFMPTDSWWHPFQQVSKQMNIIVKILKEKKRKPWDIYGFLIFSMSSTRISLHENHLTSI